MRAATITFRLQESCGAMRMYTTLSSAVNEHTSTHNMHIDTGIAGKRACARGEASHKKPWLATIRVWRPNVGTCRTCAECVRNLYGSVRNVYGTCTEHGRYIFLGGSSAGEYYVFCTPWVCRMSHLCGFKLLPLPAQGSLQRRNRVHLTGELRAGRVRC